MHAHAHMCASTHPHAGHSQARSRCGCPSPCGAQWASPTTPTPAHPHGCTSGVTAAGVHLSVCRSRWHHGPPLPTGTRCLREQCPTPDTAGPTLWTLCWCPWKRGSGRTSAESRSEKRRRSAGADRPAGARLKRRQGHRPRSVAGVRERPADGPGAWGGAPPRPAHAGSQPPEVCVGICPGARGTRTVLFQDFGP